MKNVYYLPMFLICFSLSGSAQMQVNGNRNVGINLSTPTAKLHIKSSGPNDAALRTTSSLNQTLFEVKEGGIGAGNFFIYSSTEERTIQFAGQAKFYVSSPGNVGIDQNNPSFDFELGTAAGGGGVAAKPGGGMWVGTSDRRSKKSIDEYTKGLKELMKVNPVSFVYNGKYGTPAGKSYVGVVAQELQEIAPSMVLEAKYNTATLEQEESENYDASRYEEDFLAVDPSEFIYMLINSVKEQQNIINKLKADCVDKQVIQDLKAELSKLRNEINSLKITETIKIEKPSQLHVTLTDDETRGILHQNKPNPFGDYTTIDFFIPTGTIGAQMNFYSPTGQLIKSMDISQTGYGQVNLRVDNLISGSYIYELVSDTGVIGRKTMVWSQ